MAIKNIFENMLGIGETGIHIHMWGGDMDITTSKKENLQCEN